MALLGTMATAEKCPAPPAAASFNMEKLNGTWFEIGKVQTAGGALVEGDCVCTELVYAPVDEEHATVANICHDTTPDGKLKVANATIDQVDEAGAFEERFCPTCPAVSYTIVELDEGSMVEFDCTANARGALQYCFHVMSREPTMPPSTLVALQGLMDEYGLNPYDLAWQDTNQTGCGW
jgi:apolipoprotein D and lipocalin family protein